MKFTIDWLKDYLDTKVDTDEIVETLTMIGLEVEEKMLEVDLSRNNSGRWRKDLSPHDQALVCRELRPFLNWCARQGIAVDVASQHELQFAPEVLGHYRAAVIVVRKLDVFSPIVWLENFQRLDRLELHEKEVSPHTAGDQPPLFRGPFGKRVTQVFVHHVAADTEQVTADPRRQIRDAHTDR